MTKTAKGKRSKPARSARYYQGNPGLLVLTVGKEVAEYFVERHEARDCYRCRKPLPDGTCYGLDLSAGTCDCPHGTYRGHKSPCRHLAALLALKAAGKLTA
jgi:hypothetical protein